MRMREGAMLWAARAFRSAATAGCWLFALYSSEIARLRRVLRWISAAIARVIARAKVQPLKIAVVMGQLLRCKPRCCLFVAPSRPLVHAWTGGEASRCGDGYLLLVIEARLFGVQRRVRLVRRKAIKLKRVPAVRVATTAQLLQGQAPR